MASKHRISLSDSVLNASDEIHDFSCSVCKDNNFNIEAKYFCGDCSQYFCDKCLTLHAKIHKRHVVLDRKNVARWVVQGHALVTCNLHPTKTKIFKVKEKATFTMKLPTDKKNCNIVGMTELPGGEIVLIDNSNCKAKVLDSQHKITTYCDLPAYSKDICAISGYEVAVIDNCFGSEVHFLTVSADTIKITRKFAVDNEFISISHHVGQLYLGSFHALFIYTTAGQLVKKIYEDMTDEWTVNNFALSTDGRKIYIPSSSQNKVITIDSTGHILATLQDPTIDWPVRVHVSESGYVFVSSLGSQTVLQIDQEGRKKLATLIRKDDDINMPQAVGYSTRTGRLIVGGEQNDIVVIKLQ